ncbi:MAG: ORF6N domain-containing protein, partial [Oscillospiraceae bacterium]|nr:ORF6N domain-containing protein [Oscillospiraceae bacterium]
MMQQIHGIPLRIKEYQGKRVVTFKDIDAVHERPAGTASRNFRKHRNHFIEGVDFFKITPDELRRTLGGEMDERQQNDIILITETGYLMLVKSFRDDLAWSVQRQLVSTYFQVKQMLDCE